MGRWVHPALDRLSEVRAPTLVVVGDQEHRDRLDLAQRLGRGIAGARTVIVSDAAHMVSMERPAEFNAAPRDFLRTTTAAF
jgi:pimeloyl-ACP methyl ester carboxylesterase